MIGRGPLLNLGQSLRRAPTPVRAHAGRSAAGRGHGTIVPEGPGPESLRIHQRSQLPEEHMIQLSGQLDRSTNQRLSEVLSSAVEGSAERIVVDLSQLRVIDVWGLHPILTAHLRASDRHKQLLIVPGSDAVQRVLDSIHAPFDYTVPASFSVWCPRTPGSDDPAAAKRRG
jgi:anti-anti-sigma factor